MSKYLSCFAGAGWQFFNNNGQILSGGKLYTYLAGTTTPAATYTDSTGNTANSNPVVLNAAGRSANEVWLTSAVLYKFVLTDASDVTIATYDNIPGINDFESILADLANTSDIAKGDALIGFKQANASGILAGAVARTVHSKLTEIVSVLDFGGVMNDSSAATRTANKAAYLAAVAAGVKSILIPQGTFWIDGDIEYGNIAVHGVGIFDTIIKGDGDLFKQSSGGGYGGFYDLTIKNDATRGKLFKYVGSVDTGLPEFVNVSFETATYHIYAPGPGAIVGFKLTGCRFLDSQNYSRYFESLWVHEEVNCYTWYCAGGIWVNGAASTCSIRGSVYEQLNYEAIKLTNVTTSEIDSFNLIGVHFEFNGKLGTPDIYLATTGTGRIRAINVFGCGFFSPDAAQTPARIQIAAGGGGNIDAVNLKGNSFLGAVLAVSPDSSSFQFDGNYFQGTQGSNLSSSKIVVQVPYARNNWIGTDTVAGPVGGNGQVQASITPPTEAKLAIVHVYGDTYNSGASGTNDAYLMAQVNIPAQSVRTLFDYNSALGGSNQGFTAAWSAGAIVIANKSGMSALQNGWVTITYYS